MEKLPNIDSQFAEWYNEVVYRAELADQAPVRGCMVIRPYGYAIWENIQKIVDKKIKDTGHQNAAFPLLIPESFLKREAQHVEGFAPELAVVTHAGGKQLEEPLVVRPTSETIIHHMFARWIHSWRDLPLKINQWASVVRWEMRTRPFLRTTEFWWQEGHTAHETAEEADAEALLMLREYVDLAENFLALPVIAGVKSESEKFAGADYTYTFEGVMRDGKALQMGTSHRISQSFAHAFDMQFQNRNGQRSYPYLTSWGITTRLIGAVVMVHGDQKGLVLPPAIAPIQAVIIPVFKDGTQDQVRAAAQDIAAELKKTCRVFVDDNTVDTPGAKYYRWELKGVPLRIEVGPKDLEKDQVVLVDRVDGKKTFCPRDQLTQAVTSKLDAIQKELYARALARRQAQWHVAAKLSEFAAQLEEIGGVYQTGWCRNQACEKVFKEHKATIRCLVESKQLSHCAVCNETSVSDVIVAKSY